MHFSYFKIHLLCFNGCTEYRSLFVYSGNVSIHSFVARASSLILGALNEEMFRDFYKKKSFYIVWFFLKLKKKMKIQKATVKFSAQGIGFSCARGFLCWILGKVSTWKGLSSIQLGCLEKCLGLVMGWHCWVCGWTQGSLGPFAT